MNIWEVDDDDDYACEDCQDTGICATCGGDGCADCDYTGKCLTCITEVRNG